jgi:5-carboxymethyl-2-hydroxymuconate isomerase
MINVLVTYTDNLGPEADIPSLLGKIAARLEADLGGDTMAGVCVGAVRLTEFVVGDGRPDWWSVAVTVRLPEDQLEALRAPLLDDLTTLVEAHLTRFEGRRSLTVSVELAPIAPKNVVGRVSLGERGPVF